MLSYPLPAPSRDCSKDAPSRHSYQVTVRLGQYEHTYYSTMVTTACAAMREAETSTGGNATHAARMLYVSDAAQGKVRS
jgi:hypothetical protein